MKAIKEFLVSLTNGIITMVLLAVMLLNLIVTVDGLLDGWYDDCLVPMIFIVVCGMALRFKQPTIIIKNEKGENKK